MGIWEWEILSPPARSGYVKRHGTVGIISLSLCVCVSLDLLCKAPCPVLSATHCSTGRGIPRQPGQIEAKDNKAPWEFSPNKSAGDHGGTKQAQILKWEKTGSEHTHTHSVAGRLAGESAS